ncbi:hypothetical protein [Streptomyces sp. NPDC001833]
MIVTALLTPLIPLLLLFGLPALEDRLFPPSPTQQVQPEPEGTEHD